MGQIDQGYLSQALGICSIDKNEASMKLSMITRTVMGTIGGYTVTKETTMKQIDTAQLDITACQAQAAEYHARGFNCAQAVACTLAPAVGLPRPRARPTSCRARLPSVLARRTRRLSAARSRASDRTRVRSAAAPAASTMPSRSPAMC